MNPGDIIRALVQVPEKHLALLELAWRCVGPDGRFDIDLAIPLGADIEAAVGEVRAYIEETQRMKWALERLAQGR